MIGLYPGSVLTPLGGRQDPRENSLDQHATPSGEKRAARGPRMAEETSSGSLHSSSVAQATSKSVGMTGKIHALPGYPLQQTNRGLAGALLQSAVSARAGHFHVGCFLFEQGVSSVPALSGKHVPVTNRTVEGHVWNAQPYRGSSSAAAAESAQSGQKAGNSTAKTRQHGVSAPEFCCIGGWGMYSARGGSDDGLYGRRRPY